MERQMDDVLSYQLGVVSHFIHNRHNRNLSGYNLTRAQAKVLYLLNKYGELGQSDIQKKLYIQGSTMNGIIDSLHNKELILKTDSLVDRRKKVISITESGVVLEEKLWNEIHKLEEDLLSGFSAEEKNLMASWLKKMHVNIERVDKSNDNDL